jgi:type IX secretion system PorP/SprF family membrane protein
MKRILVIFFILFVFAKANAQDPHFTQVNRLGSMINPAVSLADNNNMQVTILYRTQWNNVAPFKTQGVAFNKKVNRFTFDANVINNTAGDAGFKQIYFNGGLSYNYKTKKNSFVGGMQIGLIQHSFNPLNMTFDDQFIPDVGYSSSNATQEVFTNTKSIRPDFNLGGLWVRTTKKEKLKPFVGFALYHINQAKETFLNETSKTAMKSNVYGGFVYPVSDQVQLQSTCYFVHQGVANEFITSAIAKVNLDENKGVEGGIIYRANDALAIYTGYQLSNWMVGVSYDVNISGLTNGNGAFELTLTYQPKAKVKEPKKLSTKETAKATKDSIAQQALLTAELANPKEAKPLVVKEKEQKVVKGQRVPLTKPLLVPDKEEIATVESKMPVVLATNDIEENDIIKPTTKVELTAPVMKVEDEEELVAISSIKEIKVVVKTDKEEILQPIEKVALSQPLIIADVEEVVVEKIATKNVAPITINDTEETLKTAEQTPLTAPLVIEEREDLQPIAAIKEIKLIQEENSLEVPVKSASVSLSAPLEIAEEEVAVRDSAPELIKKNAELVIITESDDELQIAVSPAIPLTAPKVEEEKMVNEISANYMTFNRNSTAVDQIQVIDVVEPVYDSLWFNKDYQVTLVADSRDKEQLSLPRLKAVQNVLIKKGVSKDRIKLVMKDDELNIGTGNYSGAVYLKVQSVK